MANVWEEKLITRESTVVGPPTRTLTSSFKAVVTNDKKSKNWFLLHQTDHANGFVYGISMSDHAFAAVSFYPMNNLHREWESLMSGSGSESKAVRGPDTKIEQSERDDLWFPHTNRTWVLRVLRPEIHFDRPGRETILNHRAINNAEQAKAAYFSITSFLQSRKKLTATHEYGVRKRQTPEKSNLRRTGTSYVRMVFGGQIAAACIAGRTGEAGDTARVWRPVFGLGGASLPVGRAGVRIPVEPDLDLDDLLDMTNPGTSQSCWLT
ncbi:hypothetical protein C8J57DRAFT_1223051 [Mycena rebaudengoi]|nr:hypothetical protein C8J57DRAFT_1223051 [Mycena rebaudengoi]